MKSKKFIRQDSNRHIKIGRSRKKLRVWRRPKGRDSKMRLKRKGYPISPSIGLKSKTTQKQILITNLNELKNLEKETPIIISGKLGARKKLEVIKKASEMHLKIKNVKQEIKK